MNFQSEPYSKSLEIPPEIEGGLGYCSTGSVFLILAIFRQAKITTTLPRKVPVEGTSFQKIIPNAKAATTFM